MLWTWFATINFTIMPCRPHANCLKSLYNETER
jgi:hypothetical protein